MALPKVYKPEKKSKGKKKGGKGKHGNGNKGIQKKTEPTTGN
jgi:hypothetical protein